MKVGLYFGTFNPVHVGHIILAHHMLSFTDLDEVWMVVTPHSPLKRKKTLYKNKKKFQCVFTVSRCFGSTPAFGRSD